MRVFLLLCLLLSFKPAFSKEKALYTYNYSEKPINFNYTQYIRWIRPQLQSIVTNFYDILRDSHPEQKHILIFRERLFSQSRKITALYQKCFNVAFDCEKTDWRDMHTMLLDLSRQVHTFSISEKELHPENEEFLDQLLTFQSQLRTNIGKHLTMFENQMINGQYTDALLADFVLVSSYTKTNLNLLMTGTIDKTNYHLFYGLWKNFIDPIEQSLLRDTSIEVMKKELVELNIQWNGFHFQVDRKHFNVKSEIKRVIKNIHRRWTNILKVIVG